MSELAPEGIVRVNGEHWSAISVNGTVAPATPVQVLRAIRRAPGGLGRGCRRTADPGAFHPRREHLPGRTAMIVIEVVGGVVVLGFLTAVALSVKIVREYQRIVLFRLGRAIGIRGPGLVFINPVTDRTSLVDLRERFLEIPHQTAITQDNAPISIDFIIFYKVVDPAMSVLAVQNFAGAAQNVAATTLRSVVGDMPLDDVLSKREEMNALAARAPRRGDRALGREGHHRGGPRGQPAAGVLEAMTRQMSAERTRRAAITEAQGQKAGGHHARRGQPSRRRSSAPRASGSPPSCGPRVSARASRRSRRWARASTEHDAAPVPRDPEERRDVPVHQDRGPDGAGWPHRRLQSLLPAASNGSAAPGGRRDRRPDRVRR